MKQLFLLLGVFLTGNLLAAPDEELLGRGKGYPVCMGAKGSFAPPDCLVGVMSHYDKVFPARFVQKGAQARALKRAPAEVAVEFGGAAKGIDTFLGRNRNTGLLILKGDTILAERYQYERKPEHRLTSMSMAKTVTGMLVGIALHEKAIESIDDLAQVYVPALKGHPYGETPIRHLLTMSSGVEFVEAYSGNDDIMKLGKALLFQEGPAGAAVLAQFNKRIAPAGQRFSYSSADTFVLALVLRAATGRDLAAYLSEKIWQPMGAEADASWNTDPAGNELGYVGLNATLRDWGRFGLLLADGGARDGRQIIPAAWLKDATSQRAPTTGYGYQTWVDPRGDRYTLRGLRGQAIDIHPASRTVVVHTAVYGAGSGRGEQYSFFEAVLKKTAENS